MSGVLYAGFYKTTRIFSGWKAKHHWWYIRPNKLQHWKSVSIAVLFEYNVLGLVYKKKYNNFVYTMAPKCTLYLPRPPMLSIWPKLRLAINYWVCIRRPGGLEKIVVLAGVGSLINRATPSSFYRISLDLRKNLEHKLAWFYIFVFLLSKIRYNNNKKN